MKKCFKIMFAVAMAASVSGSVFAGGLLRPGDPIIAFDFDSSSNSSYPGGESPPNALDQDPGTKYLNFGQRNSGFIVTPSAGSTVIQSMLLTTANDAIERDPAAWAVYGTNEAILSQDNSDGLGENWSLIASGNVSLPEDRFSNGPVLSFANATAYSSYRVVFPAVRSNNDANSMQIGDVYLYPSIDGSGSSVLNFLDDVRAIHLPVPESRYPVAESPANAIDGDVDTKYLNFGKENSGFIVTPSVGAKAVKSFRFTTANDFEGRDPAGWILYGTNAPIVSQDNSTGNAESWTLIGSGTVDLPVDRFTQGAAVTVNNNTAYASYRMVITSLRDSQGPGVDSTQYAEVQFYLSPGGISADFNSDNNYNCADIDALVADAASHANSAAYDLTGDGQVNLADVTAWLAEAGAFRPAQTNGNAFLSGDANLDGVVDGSDYGIWNSNKFTSTAAWCKGDFNADGVSDGSDYGIWNSNKFRSAADLAVVPEPASLGAVLLGLGILLRRR